MVLITKTVGKSIKCSCVICKQNRFKLFLRQHNDTILGLQDSEVNHSDLQGRVCRNKTILAEKHYILDLVSGYTKSEASSSPTECFRGTLAKTGMSQYHGGLYLSWTHR